MHRSTTDISPALAIHRPVGANRNLMERRSKGETSGLDRSLDAFSGGVNGVTDVLSVASDGRCIAASSRLGQDEIDRLAAHLSMLNALTTSAAQYMGGRTVLNTAVQNGSGYLVAMKVDEELLVAVRADRSCDIEYVVHELCRLCDYIATARLSSCDRSSPEPY